MRRYAFTMLELVFVIVIMGIIGKFGVEFLAQAYKGFIFSNVNHTLQSNSEMAVESIASKLQFRIKDSTIGRKSTSFSSFEGLQKLQDLALAERKQYNILEWVGTDIDGFRGTSTPLWSGIIDIGASLANGTNLVSPNSNTTNINNLIKVLANYTVATDTTINNAAIYFIGSSSDIKTGYGWDGVALTNQNETMHPISSTGVGTQFAPTIGTFSGIDIFEYYQLSWTAYAVVLDANNDLTLHYDYQPWEGDKYSDANTKTALIMQNVDTFQVTPVGSVIKIQVCVNSDLVEDYSLCKEKTIF